MARKKKTKKKEDDALKGAIDTFAKGDYVQARGQFAEKMEDSTLPEGQRQMARDLHSATLLDRATILVGLGCLGLYFLVLAIGFWKQP